MGKNVISCVWTATVAILGLLAVPSAHAAVYTSELSFPSAPETALENFPVLVRISTAAPEGFSYEVCPDASHLWFTDASGDSLPFEVDTWDASGTSLVWVSVPSLSSTATITMHWADDAANVPNDIPASREIWTRAGYRAVWHFAGSAAESVTNLAATAAGSPSYNGNASYPGPLGKTLWLDGSSHLSIDNGSAWATVGENSTLTISCWARSTRTGTPGCDRMISSMSNWKDTSGYELTIQNDVKVITVGSSGANGTGSQFQTTISTGVNAKWQHFAATYTATTTSLYVDGAAKNSSALNPVVSPVAKLAIGAGANAGSPWAGGLDEVRIRAAASTADWIAAEYATMTDGVFAGFGPVTVDASVPSVATPVVTRGADGTFTVAAEVSANVPASIVCIADGDITNGMATADAAFPMTYSAALAGLAADTTYVCAVTATSTGGTVVKKHCPAAFYNGYLSVSKVSDANEDGLIPGSFRISRADTAHDLVVPYSVGGTAVAGQTYAALSGTATIPAGSASVDIDVVPIRDPKKVVDTTVVITLAAGPYGINENNASATLTIVNTPPYSTLFAYHVPITVSGYAGESTLADFPVLVTLAADSPSGFDYADCAADGSDIRFLDERDNVLSHEIETWETGGTSYIWVKVPSLAGKNTQFSLYYGTNGVSQLPEVQAADVWSRYAAVFHGGSTIADATGKSATVNAGTVTGSASGGKAGGVMTKGSAIGVQFSNPVTSHALSSASRVSVSGWFKRSNSGSTAIVAAAKNDWYETGFMALVENGTYFSVGVDATHQGASGKGALTKNVWGHLAFSYDSTALKSYFNGTSIYENASAKSLKDKGDTYWAFGSCNNQNVNCFQGDMDELRVFDGVASADWIKAECDSVDSPATFVVLDDARPAGVPYIVNPVVTREAGAFSVSAEILEAVPASIVYDADGVTGSMATSDGELPMVYSATLSGLAADTTYKCSVVATSSSGAVSSNTYPTAFYNGELTVEKVSDAVMKGFVPGVFRISRADTAHDLAVSYTVGGTAVAGQIYEALSGSATIPAGSQFVDISVVPLLDKQTTSDTTVVLTLVDGFYGISESAGSAALSIAGYKPVKPTDYNWSITATPSDAVKTTLGANAYTDFPVLVRLPAAASVKFRETDGSDLLVTDDNGDLLSFEIDTFASDGPTLVWIKVPSLSADTRLTVYFGGPENFENNPTNVWTDYVGVWHMNESSGTVADATGHGLGASSAKKTAGSVAYVGGVVGNARQTAVNGTKDYLTIPNYNSHNVGSDFTFSCWYDATARLGYDRLVSRKNSYDAGNGWEVEIASSNTKLSARGASGDSISGTFSDIVSSGWMRFAFVYSGSTLKAYLDGAQIGTGSIDAATDNGKPLSIGCNSNGSEAYFVGYVDEARLRKGAMSAKEVALEHATMADAAFFKYADIAAVDQTAQDFDAPTVIRNANGTYTISVVLAENNGDVGVIYNSGASAITNIVAENASPNTYTDTPANLVSGTTYAFAAYGKNANDTEVTKKGGIFYNGDLSVETISNAVENGLVPGAFRISRADTAHDLAVAYTVGGTATPGQTYTELSGTAIIPDGTNSVDIQVVPHIDAQTTVDTTVIVTLSAGLYGIDAQVGSAELTIVNLVTPTGFNVWVSPSNSLASIDANWSSGSAPTSSDNVLFDGRFSTANCEWDSAASATVASWTQTNDYTGTVTVDTVFPEKGGFTCLTVFGDMTIASGKVTHKAHNATNKEDYYRLRIDVGGNLAVASGASITARAKGSYDARREGGSAYGGGYDGVVSWGSLVEPYEVGSSADGNEKARPFAGGAIWIEVSGDTTLDGAINANGISAKPNYDTLAGSGGAIYLKTAMLSGSGSISADCEQTTYSSNHRTGAGGRISILLTSGEMTSFPVANITAYSGWATNMGSTGASGTVLVRTPQNENGILYARDRTSKNYGQYGYYPQKTATTGIPSGEKWTLDAIVFGANGVLRVPSGTTLSLPNGLASVSGSSALGAERTSCGILLDGGTLDIPDTTATEHVVGNGQWMLSPNSQFTLNGNLTVQGGAAVGAIHIRNTATNNFNKMDLVVKGNMTVASDGYILTEGAGLNGSDAAGIFAGTVTGAHGGAYGSANDTAAPANVAYDSILSPSLPGNRSDAIERYTSGVAFLKVEGALTVNGTASANAVGGHWYGSAGSLNIVAGSLSGTGKITANGNGGGNWDADNNYHLYPGGGRVSVRLTDAGATFTDYWETNILARGVAWNAGNGTRLHHSTAGTVYLQDGTQKEGAGTVRIFQNNATVNWTTVCTNDFTAFPSTRHGGENDDLRRVALEIGGGAHVFLASDARADSLSIAVHSTLNLNGQTLTVKRAKLGEASLAPGTYKAGDAAVSDFVTDSGEGGELVVNGIGFMLFVR